MDKYDLLLKCVNALAAQSDLGTLLVLTEYPGRVDIGPRKARRLVQAAPFKSPDGLLQVAGVTVDLRNTLADALLANLFAAGFDLSVSPTHAALKQAADALSGSAPGGVQGQPRPALSGGPGGHQFALLAVTPPPPRPGNSYTWRFSVENIFGWEFGHVEMWFDAKFRRKCTLISSDAGVTGSSTAPTVRLSPAPYHQAATVYKESETCPEQLMEGAKFEVNITFDGYINNVPYSQYIILWADGTVEYGPPRAFL